MRPEPRFDFLEIARGLSAMDVRWLLFGRQAMRLYDAPHFTHDWDLWIETGARERVLRWFEGVLGYDLSRAPTSRPPVVRVLAGPGRKIDAWFVRGMSNRDGERIDFDDVYERSVAKASEDGSVTIRIPEIDDMIALKKVAPKVRPKDEEDIQYLLVRKDLIARGRLPPG